MSRQPRRAVAAAALALGLVVSFTGDRPGAQAPPAAGGNALLSLVNAARRDIDAYWARRIQNYQPPVDVVRIQVPTVTDCGAVNSPNAFYCSSTHKIYWDTSLLSEQFQLGDFAPVFILAHEWGHLVQRQVGLMSVSGILSIQVELQADCLAGAYAHDAAGRRMLDAGDDDEAVASLRRAGDALDSPWFDAQAHGSPGLRIDAFTYGFEGRECMADQFWAFLRQRGVDPARAQQTPAPSSGRLEQLLPAMTGRFGRFKRQDVVRLDVAGAADALRAHYVTVNGPGPNLELSVVAYASTARARSQVDFEVGDLLKQGYREVKRVRLQERNNVAAEIGMAVVLRRDLEYVVWSNNHVVGVAAGPAAVTEEFFSGLPF